MLWTSIDLDLRDRLRPALQAIRAGQPCTITPAAARYVERGAERLLPLQPGDAACLERFARDRDALTEAIQAARASGLPRFTQAQRDHLRTHGIALFQDRLILDAQPPVPANRLAAVQARIDGALPQDLLDLWATSFGGTVPYDLDARFPGVDVPVRLRFSELYHSDSAHHHTLEGAIQDALEQSDRTRLDAVPIGGFEVLERITVSTTGPNQGQVWVWRQALPPAWPDPLTQDSAAVLADSVRGLFDAMFVDAEGLLDEGSPALELLEHGLRELARQDADLYARVRQAFLAAAR